MQTVDFYGHSYKSAHKRREALAQYEVVMKRPAVYNSRDRMAQGLRKPYQE
ncbi:MAG: hypothetical protein ACR2H4_14500 [Pyrinomonadaceae bacterium]